MHQAVNIEYHQGDTIPLEVEVTDDGNPTPLGTAVDISGATEIVFVIAPSAGAAATVTKLKTLAEIAFKTDGTDGIYQVTPGTEISDLAAGIYHYQSSVTIGTKETVLHGAFTQIASPS